MVVESKQAQEFSEWLTTDNYGLATVLVSCSLGSGQQVLSFQLPGDFRTLPESLLPSTIPCHLSWFFFPLASLVLLARHWKNLNSHPYVYLQTLLQKHVVKIFFLSTLSLWFRQLVFGRNQFHVLITCCFLAEALFSNGVVSAFLAPNLAMREKLVLFRIILYEWCFLSLSRMQMMSRSFSGIK